MMKKLMLLGCFYLGIWGFGGFILTLLLGFLSCCFGLSVTVYYGALIVYALVAVAMSASSVYKECNPS